MRDELGQSFTLLPHRSEPGSGSPAGVLPHLFCAIQMGCAAARSSHSSRGLDCSRPFGFFLNC